MTFLLAGVTGLAAMACGGSEPGAGGAGEEPPPTVVTPSGVEMILIPGGWFEMGYDGGRDGEGPVHTVWVDSFLMDKYEVTHEMFVPVQLPNPSHWQDHPKKPVERVRWQDAKQYCNERSLLEKLQPCYNEKTAD